MADLLYLVHRMPYPPTKGDKVRSYHLLMHLVQQGHRVWLGTFVDDPDDWQHLDALKALCAGVCALPLDGLRARLRSLGALPRGQALTLRYYHDARLHRWVQDLAGRQHLDAALVFCSAMAPYALALPGVPVLTDLVDVDSAKWRDYAPRHRWPMSWLYRREGERLLAFEAEAVRRSTHSFLVTEAEVALLAQLAPQTRGRVSALGNGVDADYFSPTHNLPRPADFPSPGNALVFTGAMDYWPNVDAVCWFAEAILPALRRRRPGLKLYIVGRSPTPAVQRLAGDAVVVTGTVPDVRPFVQHADVVVAPLRLARGVQNKVLEAMAMGRPVVAARTCVDAIDARDGEHLVAADEAPAYIEQIEALLDQPDRADRIGRAGRACVLQAYSWPGRLAQLDRLLGESALRRPTAVQPIRDPALECGES